MDIKNEHGYLSFHKQSLRGTVVDYIIYFNEREMEIEHIIEKTKDLFLRLHENYKDHAYKARLIARCKYNRLNDEHEVVDTLAYHFGSYSTEWVEDPLEFYTRHMQKIASRMDTFHTNGSSLLLQGIEHIHIAITCPTCSKPLLNTKSPITQ